MRCNTRRIRVAAALLALGLLGAACDSAATDTPTTAGGETTTEPAPSTTTTVGETTSPTQPPVVIASDGLDPAVVERLTEPILELITATEVVRGLPFLVSPTVTIVTPDELSVRVRSDLEEELDPAELAVDTRLFQLLGKLAPEDDLETMFIDLYSEQVAGFYDGDTGELVIGGEAADLTPLTKSVVVHELVHALTDQHFVFNDEYQAMWDEQQFDRGAAFQSLIEGDATYFQLVYIQELPLAEQLSVASEALLQMRETSIFDSVPAWIQDDLSFPYDTGQLFVESLVEAGGIAAVDSAYSDRPISTESVIHPARYSASEAPLEVAPLEFVIEGFESHEASTFGEWGFRQLLSDVEGAGVAIQAANGWGGDVYEVLYDSDDVLFAVAYKGDTEDDTFELTAALLTLVRDNLEMGEGVGEAGGVTWNMEDGRYAHLDRIGDGFIFVISTDAAAGASAVDQMRVP